MNYYIFRNSTLENLFIGIDAKFSGYNDISVIEKNADIYVWFYIIPVKTNRISLIKEIQSYSNSIKFLHNLIPADKTFIVFTLCNLYELNFQSGDFSLQEEINNFNTEITTFSKKHNNLKVVDFTHFTKNYTQDQLIDWKYFFISDMQLNPRLAKDFSRWFLRESDYIMLKRKKCLVLDLDNTIWGGILGEDGIDGIKMGEDYPGKVYSMFQEFLLELAKNGIILTVCSKNNEADVLEVLEKNPLLKLKKEHISTYRINWNNKAQNIEEIAKELNIGLDSMVFVDDNPNERDLIKQALPQVAVPDFPEQLYLYPIFMRKLLNEYFAVYSLTQEDLQKTNQYKANAERIIEQSKYFSFDDYLASLEMELTVISANSFNIPRIAQMTQKTNQFNLTTKRYSEAEIQSFVSSNNLIYCLNVKDKFGDNGITGVIVLKKIDNHTFEIDSFLLSCRVLGKSIENAFLRYVLQKLKNNGIKYINALYIPTNKNMQVENFYDNLGFEIKNTNISSGTKTYILDLSKKEINKKSHFKIIEL